MTPRPSAIDPSQNSEPEDEKVPASGDGLAGALLHPGLRGLLAVAAGLEVVAGISLFVFSARTDEWFAWTLEPTISAAFLGAVFWGTLGAVATAVLDRRWVLARAGVPATLGFATPLLLATFLHLDRFHLFSASLTARFAAWLWLVVYVVVPPLLSVLAVRQERAGGLPSRRQPLRRSLRLGLACAAVVGVVLGTTLFAVPTAATALWPWALTPLAARAVASGLMGIGVGAAYGAWQGDRERALLTFAGYAALAPLELLALARFAGDVAWERPVAWLHVAFFLGLGALGMTGMLTKLAVRPPRQGGAGDA